MALEPAITDIEQLKDRPEVAALLAWNPAAVTGAKFDRNELDDLGRPHRPARRLPRPQERSAAAVQRAWPTSLAWTGIPREPRFEVVYHLFSIANKRYLRLKVRLSGDDASIDSLTPIWPGANFFEREVFDLFGVRFDEHPNLKRIMMPENWEGHPLRKDYPVEGYR